MEISVLWLHVGATASGIIISVALTDSLGKAEGLNNYFKSVFTKEPTELPPDKGPSPHPFMSDICITTSGILELLRSLNVYKTSRPDLISTRFLKEMLNSQHCFLN